ncbi:MAG TPA: hypothetical protein VFA30_10425 [Gaiellaceae bacterium]|nr:hypothetical protein [Gaiellaceae bacterium]
MFARFFSLYFEYVDPRAPKRRSRKLELREPERLDLLPAFDMVGEKAAADQHVVGGDGEVLPKEPRAKTLSNAGWELTSLTEFRSFAPSAQ